MKASIISALAALFMTSCVIAPPPPPPLVSIEPAYQPGYVLTTLPIGYRTVYYNSRPYYVHHNVYYRPYGRKYVVVRRPY